MKISSLFSMLKLPEFTKDFTFQVYNQPFLIMSELYGQPSNALIMRRLKDEKDADPNNKDKYNLYEFSVNFTQKDKEETIFRILCLASLHCSAESARYVYNKILEHLQHKSNVMMTMLERSTSAEGTYEKSCMFTVNITHRSLENKKEWIIIQLDFLSTEL
jgi:hypothetical protein